MDVIRRTDLERLALQGAGPSVSLFLPTHRAGPEVRQGPIRLKNLLRQATEALQADGVRAPMVHSVLGPLRRLVNDGLFWQYQSDGLALYSRPGWWRALRGPAGDPRRPPGRGGPEAAAAVRRRSRRRGRQGDLPRVRRRHPGSAGAAVLPQGQPVVGGSPEELGLHELYARAWAVVEPLFLQAQGEAAGRYHQLAGTGLTSRDPREIIQAAKEGRVETLFAARQPTGVGSMNVGALGNGDRALRDVLEVAAVTTLLKGGTVYALPAGAVPGGGSAAVFRY